MCRRGRTRERGKGEEGQGREKEAGQCGLRGKEEGRKQDSVVQEGKGRGGSRTVWFKREREGEEVGQCSSGRKGEHRQQDSAVQEGKGRGKEVGQRGSKGKGEERK